MLNNGWLITVSLDSKVQYVHIGLENRKNILKLYLNLAVVDGSLKEFM
jgi:hypothetical protein